MKRVTPFPVRALLPIAAFLAWATIASAQSDPTELARIAADRLDAAQASFAAADSARDRVDALGRTIRAYEDGLNALREGLRQAALREAAILAEFDAQSQEASRLLGVLMSIQGAQGPLGLIHPAGSLAAARSGMIVADITPAIQARADQLRAKMQELALARSLQESAAEQMHRGLQGVQEARAALSQAVSNRTDLPKRFDTDEAAMALLQSSAETLQDFATGLIEMDLGGVIDDPIRDFAAAKGTLALPVNGQVLRGFQEADAAGIKRPGLVVATRPLSLVSTPWPATIRFSGPLLDYGNVIVLEPEPDTLLILAGMKELYGEVGQVLRPATPVGMMGGRAADGDEIILATQSGTGSARTETLYIELRQGTEPIDPTDWFVETKDKTQ